MKKSLMLILAASIGLTACNNFEKAGSGTVYKIHKSDDKEKIKVGDYVKLNFSQWTDKDSLLASTYDLSQPAVFQVTAKRYAGDMQDILLNFAEGDSATFKLDLDSMAKMTNEPRPPEVKGKYLVFNIKIEKVLHKNTGEVDSVFNKRASEFFTKDFQDAMVKLKNSENAKIENFIKENGLKTTKTASGLHYVITSPGSGAKAVSGDTVKMKYTGKFLNKRANGKDAIFDTTDPALAKLSLQPYNPMATYAPRALVVDGDIVPGMSEGMKLLTKGAKGTFIIPSSLGFGEAGARPYVGPFAPLLFEIEVVDIVKPTAGSVAPPPPVAPGM